MKDIKLRKSTRKIILEESQTSYNFVVPSFSFDNTSLAGKFKYDTVEQWIPTLAKSLCACAGIAACLYVASITTITVFAVSERNYLHKNEKLVLESTTKQAEAIAKSNIDPEEF
jgi:hypothetical protein